MALAIGGRLISATGPGLAIQELLYGFIMELIFVTAARIGMLDYGSKAELVVMIIGMNATWGAIDAVIFYLIDSFSEREHVHMINRGKIGGKEREEAIKYLMDSFSGTPLDALAEEEERRICESILSCRTEDSQGLSRDRRAMAWSSVGCFIITILTIVPVAVPILLMEDIFDGLTAASCLSSVILFFVGYSMQRYSHVNGWIMGLFLTGVSWAITLVATFTGG